MNMNKQDFIASVNSALASIVSDKSLDAWFFNDFDEYHLNCEANRSINKTLNALIPGNWQMVSLSGNGTDFGLGIFYEKDYDLWLDLACYNEDGDEFIDDYYVSEKCHFKFDEDTLARILHIV